MTVTLNKLENYSSKVKKISVTLEKKDKIMLRIMKASVRETCISQRKYQKTKNGNSNKTKMTSFYRKTRKSSNHMTVETII